MTSDVRQEKAEFGEIFVGPELIEIEGAETFTDKQVFAVVEAARQALMDREYGAFCEGVVALLDGIFGIDLLGHEKTVAMMLGALPAINTEAQNDPPVRQEPKDSCVVIRSRKNNLIQKVIGPVTEHDALKICSGFNNSQVFLATMFLMGTADGSMVP